MKPIQLVIEEAFHARVIDAGYNELKDPEEIEPGDEMIYYKKTKGDNDKGFFYNHGYFFKLVKTVGGRIEYKMISRDFQSCFYCVNGDVSYYRKAPKTKRILQAIHFEHWIDELFQKWDCHDIKMATEGKHLLKSAWDAAIEICENSKDQCFEKADSLAREIYGLEDSNDHPK